MHILKFFFNLETYNEILFDSYTKSHCYLASVLPDRKCTYAENISQNYRVVDVSNIRIGVSLLSGQGQQAEGMVRIRSGYVCSTKKMEVMK